MFKGLGFKEFRVYGFTVRNNRSEIPKNPKPRLRGLSTLSSSPCQPQALHRPCQEAMLNWGWPMDSMEVTREYIGGSQGSCRDEIQTMGKKMETSTGEAATAL